MFYDIQFNPLYISLSLSLSVCVCVPCESQTNRFVLLRYSQRLRKLSRTSLHWRERWLTLDPTWILSRQSSTPSLEALSISKRNKLKKKLKPSGHSILSTEREKQKLPPFCLHQKTSSTAYTTSLILFFFFFFFSPLSLSLSPALFFSNFLFFSSKHSLLLLLREREF